MRLVIFNNHLSQEHLTYLEAVYQRRSSVCPCVRVCACPLSDHPCCLTPSTLYRYLRGEVITYTQKNTHRVSHMLCTKHDASKDEVMKWGWVTATCLSRLLLHFEPTQIFFLLNIAAASFPRRPYSPHFATLHLSLLSLLLDPLNGSPTLFWLSWQWASQSAHPWPLRISISSKGQG